MQMIPFVRWRSGHMIGVTANFVSMRLQHQLIGQSTTRGITKKSEMGMGEKAFGARLDLDAPGYTGCLVVEGERALRDTAIPVRQHRGFTSHVQRTKGEEG